MCKNLTTKHLNKLLSEQEILILVSCWETWESTVMDTSII